MERVQFATMSDEELAAAAGTPVEAVPALRSARNRETLNRFVELYANGSGDPREVLRELKAVGGDLRALRLALTGRARGPALAAVLAALPPEEALRRVVAAL